jgi:hypothetical protein
VIKNANDPPIENTDTNTTNEMKLLVLEADFASAKLDTIQRKLETMMKCAEEKSPHFRREKDYSKSNTRCDNLFRSHQDSKNYQGPYSSSESLINWPAVNAYTVSSNSPINSHPLAFDEFQRVPRTALNQTVKQSSTDGCSNVHKSPVYYFNIDNNVADLMSMPIAYSPAEDLPSCASYKPTK